MSGEDKTGADDALSAIEAEAREIEAAFEYGAANPHLSMTLIEAGKKMARLVALQAQVARLIRQARR